MVKSMNSKKIHMIYLVITLIFLGEVILSLYGYSYLGYYSDKIINWIWLGMTIFMIIRFWKKKWIKIYFSVLVWGLIMSILPMMIPFFAIVNYFSTMDDYQQIQLNDSYRIERSRPNVLHKPQVQIYKKEAVIFEKAIYRTDYPFILEDVLQNTSLNSNKYPPIQAARLVDVRKDSIGIEYQIMDKKRIYYHKKKQRLDDQ